MGNLVNLWKIIEKTMEHHHFSIGKSTSYQLFHYFTMAIFDLSQFFFVYQRVVETSKIMGISSENHGWDPCDGGFEGEHQLQMGSIATFDYRTVNQWEHLRCLDYHLTSCSFSCFTLKLRDGWSKLRDAQEFSYVFITRREIWKKLGSTQKSHGFVQKKPE